MKRILFLLDYYREGNSANGVCCRNVAEYLVDKGYEVFVGCYRPADAPEEEIQNGVHILRMWTMPDIPVHKTWKEKVQIYLRWLDPFSCIPAASEKKRADEMTEIASAVVKKQKIDTLICIHLPSETLIAGNRLKKLFPHLFVCAYQLDTLSGGNLPRHIPAAYARWRRIAWERYLFCGMDYVILMKASREHHAHYTAQEAWMKRAAYGDVPLFMPRAAQEKCARIDGCVHIVFAGTMAESIRTPYHVINVLSRLKRYRVKLTIAGMNQCRCALATAGSALELTELGLIGHERVLELLDEADVLLSIGAKNVTLPSGKIFEYMAFGKPVIATYWSMKDVSLPYLEKYPLTVTLDECEEDLDAQAEKIERFFDRYLGKHVEPKVMEAVFRENTPAAFEKLLVDKTDNRQVSGV